MLETEVVPTHHIIPNIKDWPYKIMSVPFRKISLILIFLASICSGLRCFTDVKAQKSKAVECGFSSGCVKIFISRANQPIQVIRRDCFVLAVPDRCYQATNGLSYCWCSKKDLCNLANSTYHHQQLTFCGLLTFIVICIWHMQ